MAWPVVAWPAGRLAVAGVSGEQGGKAERHAGPGAGCHDDRVVVAQPTTPVKQVARLLADPARVDMEVRDGVVSLTGRVERRSLIPIVVRLAGATEGWCGSRTD